MTPEEKQERILANVKQAIAAAVVEAILAERMRCARVLADRRDELLAMSSNHWEAAKELDLMRVAIREEPKQ